MSLVSEVVEFISNEREPIHCADVAMELVRLGANTNLWSKAEYMDWIKAMGQAVKDGLLVEIDGKLRIKPEETAPNKSSQLELF
jgi:hypothetical protein